MFPLANSLAHAHRAPIPEDEPLPGEEPIPQDDPEPHPDPEIKEPPVAQASTNVLNRTIM